MEKAKDKMVRMVIEVILAVTESEPVELLATSNPIEELKIDSGHGIPFALEMEDRLRIEIPVEINPFVVDDPMRRARTIGEIADLFLTLSSNEEADND